MCLPMLLWGKGEVFFWYVFLFHKVLSFHLTIHLCKDIPKINVLPRAWNFELLKFGGRTKESRRQETHDILLCADISTDTEKITFHVSYVTCHLSHVMCHILSVTRHLSPLPTARVLQPTPQLCTIGWFSQTEPKKPQNIKKKIIIRVPYSS